MHGAIRARVMIPKEPISNASHLLSASSDMSDINIRKDGQAGRITLNRPDALNSLTWDMCLAIEKAIDTWADDPEIALIIIDGAGEKAFCAGGDIHEMYRTGTAGDFTHGFTLGGGVGVGCHGSHRIVCEDSVVGLPEASIGLVPDVGGSLILARAPGRIGEYLGLTADRMDAADAIHAGFADYFIPKAFTKYAI